MVGIIALNVVVFDQVMDFIDGISGEGEGEKGKKKREKEGRERRERKPHPLTCFLSISLPKGLNKMVVVMSN